MAENNGWAIKNRWGTILLWTVGYLRKDVIEKVGGLQAYEEDWRDRGHKIIKIKLVER